MCKIDIRYQDLPLVVSRNNDEEPYHWHTNAQEIIWILEGEAEVIFNNQPYSINKADDIILISDSDAHKIIKKSQSLDYISFHIDVPYFEKYITDITYVVIYCNPGYRNDQQVLQLPVLRKLLARILLQWKTKNTRSQQQIIDLLQKLLLILRNHFNYMGKTIINYNEVEKFNRMYKICYYLYEHFEEKVSLSQLADYVHVNESYLSRNLKEITGLGFTDTLNFIRCEKSIRLLLSTEDTITKISYDCGFSDPKYFNHYFSDFFGSSPVEFRTQNKTDQWKYYHWRQQEDIVFDPLLTGFLLQTIEGDHTFSNKSGKNSNDQSILLSWKPEKRPAYEKGKPFCLGIEIRNPESFVSALQSGSISSSVGSITDKVSFNPDEPFTNRSLLSILHFCIAFDLDIDLHLPKERWKEVKVLLSYSLESMQTARIHITPFLYEYGQLHEKKPAGKPVSSIGEVFDFLLQMVNLADETGGADQVEQQNLLSLCIQSDETNMGLFSKLLIPEPLFYLSQLFSGVRGGLFAYGEGYMVFQDDLGFFLISWNDTGEEMKHVTVELSAEEEYQWLITKHLLETEREMDGDTANQIWDALSKQERNCIYNLYAPRSKMQMMHTEECILREAIPNQAILFARFKSLQLLKDPLENSADKTNMR